MLTDASMMTIAALALFVSPAHGFIFSAIAAAELISVCGGIDFASKGGHMKVVTRIRDGQLPASHTVVNQSEFANPTPSHSPTFEEIQFRLDDWLRTRREPKEEHRLGTMTIEQVDLP
jgi:hypothetical protein